MLIHKRLVVCLTGTNSQANIFICATQGSTRNSALSSRRISFMDEPFWQCRRSALSLDVYIALTSPAKTCCRRTLLYFMLFFYFMFFTLCPLRHFVSRNERFSSGFRNIWLCPISVTSKIKDSGPAKRSFNAQ